MGHHIDKDGNFKSDKYPWCPTGFVPFKFTDRNARIAIRKYADITSDSEFAKDLITVCDTHTKADGG